MAKQVEIEQKYKDGYVKFKLHNVEVWWAHVHKPDTEFGNNKYCIEMHLSDAVAKQLIPLGFNVRDKKLKDGTVIKNVFKAKKEKVLKNGTVQAPPFVVGPDGKTPFTDNIGNGSICNLQLSARAWPVRGEWTMGCYLDGIQVADHIPFASTFDDISASKPDANEVPF